MTKRMEKWTPGPWEVEGADLPCDIGGHAHHYWSVVAPGADTGVAIVILPDEDRTRKSITERKATVHLIAKAPEMAEALKSFLAAADCSALMAATKVATRILTEMRGEKTQEVNHG